MFYAFDENNVRTLIDDASKRSSYHCPCCDNPVIVKQGKVNAWHYAHKPGSNCDAAYSEKTQWHREWQNMFPEECREVVVQDITGYKRIADVKIDGTTVEFQSKSIPKDLFDARNRHHARASGQVIWVFDCRGKDINREKKVAEKDGSFDNKYWCDWAHPNRLLAKYLYYTWRNPPAIHDKGTNEYFKCVTVYLHCDDDMMLQVLYVNEHRENMKCFLARQTNVATFVKKLTNNYFQPTQITICI